jgi:hypothetical protein
LIFFKLGFFGNTAAQSGLVALLLISVFSIIFHFSIIDEIWEMKKDDKSFALSVKYLIGSWSYDKINWEKSAIYLLILYLAIVAPSQDIKQIFARITSSLQSFLAPTFP